MKNRIFCKSLVAGMVSFSLMLGADCADLWGGTG
jgi:hypothetical protein